MGVRDGVISARDGSSLDRQARLVYSVGGAAELLGIGRMFAYEQASRGELPGVFRLGRRTWPHQLVIFNHFIQRDLRDLARGRSANQLTEHGGNARIDEEDQW